MDDTAADAGAGGWLTPNLRVLSGVSLLQDAASELLYPVMPIFLTSVLGAPVAVVGGIEGAAEAMASLTKLVAGRIADRQRKRPLVAAGYGLAALGKAIVAVAFVWPVVLLGRTVDRLGKGIRGAPRDALLVEGIPTWARGRAFGFHRAADTLGAVIGPLIGLAAYEALGHRIRPLLVLAVVPAVLSVLLVGAVREGAEPDQRTRVATSGDLPRPFWRVLTVLVGFNLFNFPDALLLLRVRALGFSVAGVILVYVAYNASYAALSYPLGALADRVSPPRVLAGGLVCFGICYAGLGLIHDGAWAWPLLIGYGGYTAATDGVGKAWISALVPATSQGRAQGLYQGLTGGAVLVAGIWAGLVWHGNGRVPLVACGLAGLAVSVVLLGMAAPRRPQPAVG